MANIIANKNKNGEIISYRIRVSLGYDLNGNQIQKTTTFKIPPHTTESKGRKMAQEYAVEYEQHCRGYSTLRENMRFSELAEWYFQNYAPVELKESTVYNYKSQYENHLAPKIGNMKLKDITTPKITKLMQSYTLNPNTVKKIYVVMQSILTRAVEQGFIRDTPCKHVILPKRRKNKKPVMDEQQVKAFLNFLDTEKWDADLKTIVKVLLYTGMRSGECLGLRWEDIDFENRTISINYNLADIAGKHFLTTPKTESSQRVIGMSQTLHDILTEHKAFQDELVKSLGTKCTHPEMVFTSALGNYRDRGSVYTSFKRFTKGTEFETMTLHQMRHLNATLLLNSGVDLKIVSEHLGHSGVEVTADVYADVLKSSKMKVADLISLKLA